MSRWHYLEDDENDLPKKDGWYIICTGSEWTNGRPTHKGKNYDSDVRISRFKDGKWDMGMVVAWMKKPKHPYENRGDM